VKPDATPEEVNTVLEGEGQQIFVQAVRLCLNLDDLALTKGCML
jgi:t-SNARE complex subunit (syntaxin)